MSSVAGEEVLDRLSHLCRRSGLEATRVNIRSTYSGDVS